MSNETSTLITLANSLGVPVVILLIIFVGIWKAAPRVGAFFTSLTEELKAMTRTMGKLSEQHTEHHSVVVTKIDAVETNIDAKMQAMEARIREHGRGIAGELGREVRDTVTQSGQHVAMTVHDALDALHDRQSSNPGFPAVTVERISPPPSHGRAPMRSAPLLPDREPSTARDPSRPSWERPGGQR